MTTVITVFRAVVIILAITIGHEGSHAVSYINQGIPVREIVIGTTGEFIPSYKIVLWALPGTTITLSALPVGGETIPTDEGARKLSQMPYKDNAKIMGNGVVVSWFCGILLLLLLNWKQLLQTSKGKACLIAGSLTLLALYLVPGTISAYILPGVGWIILINLVAYNTKYGSFFPEPSVAALYSLLFGALTVRGWINLAALGSVASGCTNALPLYPTDTGKITGWLVANWASPEWHESFKAWSSWAFWALVAGIAAAVVLGEYYEYFKQKRANAKPELVVNPR